MPLLSATRKAATLSPPLPVPNSIFQRSGLAFRRGQYTLMVAGPGVGKSILATNLAIRTRVPCMFFSADSDEWTVKTRAIAILTGQQLDKIESQLNGSDDRWVDLYTDYLSRADHIEWSYRTDIDMEFIVLRLQAYAEMYGEYPHLVVVDNLGNTIEDQMNEFPELRANSRELQRVARYMNTHVLGLHHVTGEYEDGTKPIGLAGVMGKVSKIPETVLGLNRAGNNLLHLTVPKQRGGKAGMTLQMPVDYSTATIGGFA